VPTIVPVVTCAGRAEETRTIRQVIQIEGLTLI